MQTVYLSLGSNIGNRQHYLQNAIHLLGENAQILIEKSSHFYESSPVGKVDQDPFINLALKISTTLEPFALLDAIHEIEQKMGRERKIHWGPRTLDIDILFYGDLKIKQEKLTLPHKELFNRLFVLVPLLEIIDESFEYFSEITSAKNGLAHTNQSLQQVAKEPTSKKQIETAVQQILLAVGEAPNREGLRETPARVAKMYQEILSSQGKAYFSDYKLFKTEPSEVQQSILMKDIPFYSLCEHHMLPFFGKVHVAYLPQNGTIIGLSKIPRLVDFVSHKLSVQENMTREIAETLARILKPKGVAVVVEARHLCVEMRGIKKQNSSTKTSFFLGEFETNINMKKEFWEILS